MKGGLLSIGFVLVFIGIALIFLGALAETIKSKDTIRGGGVIMIGPFPIIFGSDAESAKTVIILTIVLILIAFLIFSRFGQ